MTPTYSDGDYLLTAKWPSMSTVQGDVVVVDHPSFGVIVKRVGKTFKHCFLSLHGDNPDKGVTSDQIGLVHKRALVGKVLGAIKK